MRGREQHRTQAADARAMVTRVTRITKLAGIAWKSMAEHADPEFLCAWLHEAHELRELRVLLELRDLIRDVCVSV
jgi:hypothetical protein